MCACRGTWSAWTRGSRVRRGPDSKRRDLGRRRDPVCSDRVECCHVGARLGDTVCWYVVHRLDFDILLRSVKRPGSARPPRAPGGLLSERVEPRRAGRPLSTLVYPGCSHTRHVGGSRRAPGGMISPQSATPTGGTHRPQAQSAYPQGQRTIIRHKRTGAASAHPGGSPLSSHARRCLTRPFCSSVRKLLAAATHRRP